MQDIGMFEILELPEESLKRVLRQAPAHSLARLLAAYPRAVNSTFMNILSQCMSRPTLEFLLEEMSASKAPSFSQIRQAESELIKIMQAENLMSLVAKP